MLFLYIITVKGLDRWNSKRDFLPQCFFHFSYYYRLYIFFKHTQKETASLISTEEGK